MANKEINELTAASLPLDLSELLMLTQADNSRKVSVADMLGEIKWLSARIGEPIGIWDHLTGADVPPTDNPNFRFIKLTSGLTGSGQYNEGVLTSESVTGSAPLVIATAVIDDAASPMDGEVINLINTERRFLRAGASGDVEAAQIGYHRHGLNAAGGGNAGSGPSIGHGFTNQGYAASAATEYYGTVGDENRVKNIGATYYMRIS